MIDLSAAWPEWEAVQKLGEGSYGTVYKAKGVIDGEEMFSAVKVITIPKSDSEYSTLRVEGMSKDNSKSYFADIVESFSNEIKLLEELKDAPSIVRIEDSKIVEHTDEVRWDIYIRMELLTGFKQYSESHTMSEADVVKLGTDICTALEECEKKKIVHRDIKPENLFVDSDGNFKIGDFGVARQLENTVTTMSQKGTYNYMAPEVASKKKSDRRADIYSLGMVMYKLLNNNREPFVDPDKQMVRYQERVDAVEKRLSGEKLPVPKNASDKMAKIILKACEFDKENRYSNASEFKNDIEKLASGQKVKIRKRIRKKQAIISAVSALLVICIVGGSVGAVKYRKGKTDNSLNNLSEANKITTTEPITTEPTTTEAPTTEDKIIEASGSDFDHLAELLNNTFLRGYANKKDENDEIVFELYDYDCESADAYDLIKYEVFPYMHRSTTAFQYLFGINKMENHSYEYAASDPLNKFEPFANEKNIAYHGYIKYDADCINFEVEKVFNLDMETLMKQDGIKDRVYLYNGDYYCRMAEGGDGTGIELSYDYNVKRNDGSYVVTLNAVYPTYQSDIYSGTIVGKVLVDCSFKECNGMKYWSIKKISKRSEDKKQVKKWQATYANFLKTELNKIDSSDEDLRAYFLLACIDDNDIPELEVFLGGESKVKLYTYKDSKIVDLGSYCEPGNYNTLNYQKKQGTFYDDNATYELNNTSVKKIWEYDYDNGEYIVDGKRMNFNKFEKYRTKYMPYDNHGISPIDLTSENIELFRKTNNLYQFGL